MFIATVGFAQDLLGQLPCWGDDNCADIVLIKAMLRTHSESLGTMVKQVLHASTLRRAIHLFA